MTLLIVLNKTIREFQIDSVGWSEKVGNRVIRLYDWMTADNPFMHRFPEITHGSRLPDPQCNSYGCRYSWETVGLIRKPVCVEGPTQAYYDKEVCDGGLTTAIAVHQPRPSGADAESGLSVRCFDPKVL